MSRLRAIIAGFILWGAGQSRAADPAVPTSGPAADPAGRVIILANSRQPESVQLAGFYATQRGVPAANILALPLPETESITWREFIDQVFQPVQDELYRRGWLEGTDSTLLDRFGRRRYAFTGHRISYLIACRGVPLRIYNDPTLLEADPARKTATEFNRNEAAVDAELSLLAQSGSALTGLIPNPLFANDRPASLQSELVVKVSRLDGPTWESARHLVTAALEAERTGLLGRYYVDLGGPDRTGDQWLASVQAQLQELGFDGDAETTSATFPAEARFDAPVLYFGWYAGGIHGPFMREGFVFPPGAIALHIYSYSAQTLRSDSADWCGPFVARGVTATVGNVFEPFLQLTHRPDLLVQALRQGKNFGDAVYYALPALSWQAVAIGDPLYRPFKVTLEEQERAAGGLPAGLAPYAVLRRANLLSRQGHPAEELACLKAALSGSSSLPLALAFAQLASARNDAPAGVAALGFAASLQPVRPEDWPLLREIAGWLAAHDGRPAALQVYAHLARSPAPTPGAQRALLTEAGAVADAAGDRESSAEFARQLEGLNAPPPAN